MFSYDEFLYINNANNELSQIYDKQLKSCLNTASLACHELKNQAALISSYCQLFESAHPELANDRFYNKISANTASILKLLDDIALLRYSYLDTNMEPVNLLDCVYQAQNLLEPQVRELITIEAPSTKPVISGNLSRLSRCLVCMFTNSIEADCSYIKIVFSDTSLNNQPAVKLSIADNGTGFSEEMKCNGINPFITSKKSHLGLGLSIAYNTIINHRGNLIISSKDNLTTIDILLPRI